MSSGWGARRPEKRVLARSRPCQKRWTGSACRRTSRRTRPGRRRSSRARARSARCTHGRSWRARRPGERCRDRDPERRLDDLDVEAVVPEQPVQVGVERGDREAVLEREPGGDAAVGAQDEAVVDEVEGQVEARRRRASGAGWSGRARPRRERRSTSGCAARVVASLTLPTICAYRCSVCFVCSQAAYGSSGRALSQSTTKATSSMTHQLQSSPGSAERRIGMPVRVGVLARVAVRRRVAAADLAAGHAHPEVHPAAAGGEAVLATGDRLRQLQDPDLVRVGADCAHVASMLRV